MYMCSDLHGCLKHYLSLLFTLLHEEQFQLSFELSKTTYNCHNSFGLCYEYRLLIVWNLLEGVQLPEVLSLQLNVWKDSATSTQ